MSIVSELVREIIAEANVQKMGRRKLVRARVRTVKGKPTIQRRKVLSAVKGYTIRGGKLIRMTQAERLRRRLSQRRAKFKRRAKMARAMIKRKRSMQRRKGLGLR